LKIDLTDDFYDDTYQINYYQFEVRIRYSEATMTLPIEEDEL